MGYGYGFLSLSRTHNTHMLAQLHKVCPSISRHIHNMWFSTLCFGIKKVHTYTWTICNRTALWKISSVFFDTYSKLIFIKEDTIEHSQVNT